MTGAADQFAPALATRLIDRFGVFATLVQRTPNINFVQGNVAETTNNVSVIATPPLEWSRKLAPEESRVEGASISFVKGDVSPNVTDELSVSGITWSIVQVDPFRSGFQTAAYRLWLK